jgi:membrane fusion protein (multidrug efflux system)
MTCEAIELGPQRSEKSLANPRKRVRQAVFCLLLAAGIIAAAGCFAAVLVGDNQPGSASQVTRPNDGRDVRAALDQWAALDQARAELETAEAAIHNLDVQIIRQKSLITQMKVDIAEAHALPTFAADGRRGRHALTNTSYATMPHARQAETASQQISAQLQRNHANLAAAESRVGLLATERVEAEAKRDRSQASLHQAALKLSYTNSEIEELDEDVMRDTAW